MKMILAWPGAVGTGMCGFGNTSRDYWQATHRSTRTLSRGGQCPGWFSNRHCQRLIFLRLVLRAGLWGVVSRSWWKFEGGVISG